MATPSASVIVRCRDEHETLARTLTTLREQTVSPEVIVVDSGSVDGSLDVARRLADRLIQIAPDQFSYGRSLNIGAAAACAPIHFALSAHCFAPPHWVECALGIYDAHPDVAGLNGIQTFADGSPVTSTFFQDASHAHSNPWWGFSNHASSWRASIWRDFPFHEEMGAAEDREWAWRVTAAGWRIAYDPRLWVDMSHSWKGARNLYSRQRRSARDIADFAQTPPYTLRDLRSDWWTDIPDDRHSATAHRWLNVARLAGLAGRYVGHRQASRRRKGDATASRLTDA